MADNSKIIFSGGAGVAIGVALGLLFGGPDVSGIEAQVEEAGQNIASANEQIAGFGDRLTAIEASIAEGAAPLSGEDLANAVKELTETTLQSSMDQASDLTENLKAAIAESASSQVEKLSSAINESGSGQLAEIIATLEARNSELMDQLSGGSSDAGDAAGSEGDSSAPATDAAIEIDEDTTQILDEGSDKPVIARTITLQDGAIRVYIAGYLDQDDSVMLAVNGFDVQKVRKGRSTEVEVGDQTCKVTFIGIEDQQIKLEGECN